jgi:hypothetical protein
LLHYFHSEPLVISSFGILTAFLFGLFGSVHCLGMCGPLVTLSVQRTGLATTTGTLHKQLLLYNLGRVIVYTDLGFLLGGAGRLLGLYPLTSGILGILAGGFVAATGVHFLSAGKIAASVDQALAKPTQMLASLWRRFLSLTRSPGVILLGGLHGLLPCSLLYVMFSSAVAMQSPLPAALLLFSFSLGTVPMMWGLGMATHFLTPGKRVVLQRVFGGIVLLWGSALIAHGIEQFR